MAFEPRTAGIQVERYLFTVHRSAYSCVHAVKQKTVNAKRETLNLDSPSRPSDL